MEWTHAELPYEISDERERLQPRAVFELLQTSYWAAHRTEEIVRRSMEQSLNLGLYHQGQQVGMLRVVTDYATFGWVCDVMVHPEHRSRGLGKWLVECLLAHPAVSGLNLVLGTRDAHGLYEQHGFMRWEAMIRRGTSTPLPAGG